MRSEVRAPVFGVVEKTWAAARVAVLGVPLLAILGGGSACHPPPQGPFVFTAPPMAREPIDALRTALRESGHPAVFVDGQQGIVRGRWDDTGQRAKPIEDRETTVIRRYTARLEPSRFGSEVTLSAEAQRCVLNNFTLTDTDVTGTCEPLPRLPPQQEAEVKKLGARLQQLMLVP
jgi:hypothetical protein